MTGIWVNRDLRHGAEVDGTGAEAEAAREFVVVDGRLDTATRIVRFLGGTLLVTFILGLVGALVMHATIIQNQRDLDGRNNQIAQLEVETQELRHRLAELEAPSRIVAEARAMGMIEAPDVVYLPVPSAALDDRTLSVAEWELDRNS